jgi:hypothetical protein
VWRLVPTALGAARGPRFNVDDLACPGRAASASRVSSGSAQSERSQSWVIPMDAASGRAAGNRQLTVAWSRRAWFTADQPPSGDCWR